MSSGSQQNSTDYLTVENEANFFEWSLLLGRGRHGETCDSAEVKWVDAGVSIFNRVFDARFKEDEADSGIAGLIRRFRSRSSSVLWVTSPSNRPSDLDGRLERCGFNHVGDWSAMACDLRRFSCDGSLPSGSAVVQVSDSKALETWSCVVCKGFGIPDSLKRPTFQLFSDMGLEEDLPWRHYLLLQDGSPAASCTVFFGSSSAGIYLVATVPEARRRGLASAITQHAMLQARRRGYDLVILQASQMGQMVYPRIGFIESARMGLYHLRA